MIIILDGLPSLAPTYAKLLQRGRHEIYLRAKDGAPGLVRTGNPQLRRLVLYPVELRARVLLFRLS